MIRGGRLYNFNKALILSHLERFAWNRTVTAVFLGISVRGLRVKLTQYKKDGDKILSNPTNESRRGRLKPVKKR